MSQSSASTQHVHSEKQSIHGLTLAALGVVFGDIGTSPLYAVREVFHPERGLAANSGNVLGILSLIVWSLIVVISIKYLLFVMRADNKGEGGVLVLTWLAAPRAARKTSAFSQAVLYLGLFGSALLFGDGVLTPAVTVMGAIEGLEVASPWFARLVVPITIGILFGLFYSQHLGSGRIGRVFGPIILLWFIVIGALGLAGAVENPEVFSALDPRHAIDFFVQNGWIGVLALGAVFLVVTGGEALYADMGHFGRRPILRAWFFAALPCLLLNYFGQGALLLSTPSAADNPFYKLAPTWSLYPLVILATAAAVIASQALITGVFSLTRHTSSHEIGQIYIPQVNWLLFIMTAWLVVSFGSSSELAAAYGIAVSLTMVITTFLTCIVAANVWRWSWIAVGAAMVTFLTVDVVFLSANFAKIAAGGWVPLAMGLVVFTLMTTWRTGRSILKERLREKSVLVEEFIQRCEIQKPVRIPGVAVFMTGDQKVAPLALAINLRHNKALHAKNILLTVISKEVPSIPFAERIEIENFPHDFYRVVARYGFMETPDINDIIAACNAAGLKLELPEITFFLGRETLSPSARPGMAIWREHLFSFMSRNAERATAYFNIPAGQVIEVGIQVEI
ncbi:MAG: potassium transporter Kup [Bdellovibrionota bacterium]